MRSRAIASPGPGPILIAVAGAGVLAARLPLLELADPARMAAPALALTAIGVASLVAPAMPGPRRLPSAVVLVTGLAGLASATVVVGPPPGVPMGTWALPFAVLAAPAEELLFRRLMYGLLARRSDVLAIAVTAIVFALVHLPLYGAATLPVNLGAGLLLSWQRWASGSWTVPAATHAAANLVAVIR